VCQEETGEEQTQPDGVPSARARHESNSAKRTSKDVKRPVGGRQATDRVST
jgi:hypothetical protein